MVSETKVFHAADGEDLVILACTVFDWSIHVTDGQTDRQTELRWLRHATAVAAVARKSQHLTFLEKRTESSFMDISVLDNLLC